MQSVQFTLNRKIRIIKWLCEYGFYALHTPFTIHLWTSNMLGCRLCHSENYYLFKCMDIYARHCITSSLSLHWIQYGKSVFGFRDTEKWLRIILQVNMHFATLINLCTKHCTICVFDLKIYENWFSIRTNRLQSSNQIQFSVMHTRFALQLICLTVQKSVHFSSVPLYHCQISI